MAKRFGKVNPSDGAAYPLFGDAPRGGIYNSHIVSGVIFLMLAAFHTINGWLVLWLETCLIIGLVADRSPWKKKIALRAIPGQTGLYLQVLGQAIKDALIPFGAAFVLYLCVAPIFETANLGISSFVMLYAFYMIYRAFFLVRYLWLFCAKWDDAGRKFELEGNLRSRKEAIRHVVWAYFLGNVGLAVRCSSQVVTIGLFEYFRQRFRLDLNGYPALTPHLLTICLAATLIYLGTFYMALQSTFRIYYRTHRTFHSCRPLYDSIHCVHHKGKFPTQLDSGTISPLEFFITEMAIPFAALVPNWWWVGAQILTALFGHLPSHDSSSRMKSAKHHLDHHRYFNVNFGLTPAADRQYGTLRSE